MDSIAISESLEKKAKFRINSWHGCNNILDECFESALRWGCPKPTAEEDYNVSQQQIIAKQTLHSSTTENCNMGSQKAYTTYFIQTQYALITACTGWAQLSTFCKQNWQTYRTPRTIGNQWGMSKVNKRANWYEILLNWYKCVWLIWHDAPDLKAIVTGLQLHWNEREKKNSPFQLEFVVLSSGYVI